MPKPLPLLLLGFVLSGCQTSTDGLSTGSAPAELSGPAVSAIAGDMVSRLAEHVGPGSSAIKLNEDPSPFGQAIEAALKGWGYAVVTGQDPDEKKPPLKLAYFVDDFEGRLLFGYRPAPSNWHGLMRQTLMGHLRPAPYL